VSVIHQMSPWSCAVHYTNELDRISGEKRPGNSTLPLKLPMGAGGKGKVWGTYLRSMDSNAVVGVRNSATGKALEGADRQTDRLSTHYSKISLIQHFLLPLSIILLSIRCMKSKDSIGGIIYIYKVKLSQIRHKFQKSTIWYQVPSNHECH